MADTSVLLNLIKKTAIEVMNTAQPCTLQYGTVKSIHPLQIALDENGKIVLTESFLVLTGSDSRDRRRRKDHKNKKWTRSRRQSFIITDAGRKPIYCVR